MRRLVAVVTVFLVVAAGCSDSGGEAAPDGGGAVVDLSMVVDTATVSAIDTCVESLGPEGAFRGVLFAFDNGYDAEQVTAAMSDGSLDANGVIAGVSPSGELVGSIDRSGPSAHGGVILAAGPVIVAAGPVTAEEFKRAVGDEIAAMFPDFNFITVADTGREELSAEASRAMIATMISLVSAGYTLEQVVDAVIFGEEAIDVPAPGKRVCLVLVDARDEVVVPNNDPMDGHCSDFYESIRRQQAAADTTTITSTTMAPVDTTVAEVATTGTVSGVVLDVGSGDGVGGATVTVTPGGFTTATDPGGLFTLADLTPGGYVVTVTADGFLDGTADVTVTAGETADITIGLSIDDQLPWVYQGTGVSRGYIARPVWTGGTPETSERQVDVKITLFPDGTVEIARDMSGALSVYMDCTDKFMHRKPYEGPPIQILPGTHADGEFEVPFGGTAITGTYNSREIEGGWSQESTVDWCDDGNPVAHKSEFSFGPEGMARVYDIP